MAGGRLEFGIVLARQMSRVLGSHSSTAALAAAGKKEIEELADVRSSDGQWEDICSRLSPTDAKASKKFRVS